MRIPLGTTDLNRTVAGEPYVPLLNRYFEADPTNQKDQVALLSRPCLKKWWNGGDGAIRQVYSQPGSFSEALFFVAGTLVYKATPGGAVITNIGALTTRTGFVSMAATDIYLFVADGSALYYYTENDYARGTLTASGSISSGETVTIGSIHYKFATDLTPSADGSSGTPWLVLVGSNTAETLANLAAAINDDGTAAQYSAAIEPHPDVEIDNTTDTTLTVRARAAGTDANSIATTETMANGAWGAATLAGGGGTAFNTITVPDNLGIVSVGVIDGFCICVVAQNQGENGRFYWIEPGSVTIDALDFATAERSPDPAWEVKIVGDQFWLPGSDSNEVWVVTGDGDAPFLRQQGRLFDQGIWPGTIVKMKDGTVIACGTDGTVYAITDGPRVISTPQITQRIREAINAQRAA
jgi:hypothetical protein